MAEPSSSSDPGPDAEPPDDPGRGADGPLVDAPGWARLLLVLAPFALGGLVILLLRALGG